MPFDRPPAEEQHRADLRIGQAVAGEARDLLLLRVSCSRVSSSRLRTLRPVVVSSSPTTTKTHTNQIARIPQARSAISAIRSQARQRLELGDALRARKYPRFAPMLAVVCLEEQSPTDVRSKLRIATAYARNDVCNQRGSGSRPIARPQLVSVNSVVRREVERPVYVREVDQI